MFLLSKVKFQLDNQVDFGSFLAIFFHQFQKFLQNGNDNVSPLTGLFDLLQDLKELGKAEAGQVEG